MSDKKIQVKCIKQVVMNDSKYVAFKEGKVYDASVSNSGTIGAKNEIGDRYHIIKDTILSEENWFEEHFEVVGIDDVNRKINEILILIDYGKLQAQLDRNTSLISEYEWLQWQVNKVLKG